MVFPALGVLLFTPPTAVFICALCLVESTIPDAGFGLFSLVARPKGFHLVDYLGEVVSNTVIEQRYPKKTLGAYSLKLSASLFLDSALSRGVGACANAPGKGMRPNVCFVAHAGSKSARLEVVRPIKPGEEIFVSYGRDYWRKADAPHFTVDVPDWEWDLSDPFAVPSAPTRFLSPLLRRLLLPPLHLWDRNKCKRIEIPLPVRNIDRKVGASAFRQ